MRAQSRFRYFASLCHTGTGGRPLLQLDIDPSETKMRSDQVGVRRPKGTFHESDRLQQAFLSVYPLPIQGRQVGKIRENQASYFSLPAAAGNIERLVEKSPGVSTLTLLQTRHGEDIQEVGQFR